MVASDNRSPSRTGNAQVTVNVRRDIAPRFVLLQSPIQLDEADLSGKLVTNVTAVDDNLIVSIVVFFLEINKKIVFSSLVVFFHD